MLVVTYIPLRRNDGKPVGNREFEGLLKVLLALTGGFTVSGPVRGVWKGKERVYDERNYRVEVACDAKTVKDVRRWIVEVGRRLGQEAMYCEVRKDRVEIIPIE
jgi:hypothetical protein